MKTNCIVSKTSSLLLTIMAVNFALFTLGCEEVDVEILTHLIKYDTQESEITEPQLNEFFIVDPAGTRITVLNGTVELYFLNGAVLLPTRFNISSFPIADLDLEGHNMQKWGIIIESTSEEKTFSNMVRIWLKYDLDQFEAGTLQKGDHLTIYSVDQNDFTDTEIESIGNCSIDLPYQRIKGYINKCGYYIVGKK
ncbi:MAG: hypothetical protein ABFS38_14960 [Bacteroidota bacterium]